MVNTHNMTFSVARLYQLMCIEFVNTLNITVAAVSLFTIHIYKLQQYINSIMMVIINKNKMAISKPRCTNLMSHKYDSRCVCDFSSDEVSDGE